MKLFSQRKGYKPFRDVLQFESVDDSLRTHIWNLLYIIRFEKISIHFGSLVDSDHRFLIRIWDGYFNKPVDTLSRRSLDEIRSYVFSCEWFEFYDFLEFFVQTLPETQISSFTSTVNLIFEEDMSAYRFIGINITEITSDEEINEVEEVLKKSPDTVRLHLKNAIDLLSDRKSPNFRNSIKESISAVESVCFLISGERRSLGKALNKMEKDDLIDLHGALKSGFSSIYGYTNDSDGIRHALLEEPNLSFEDAKFMLVSCSAFINYLLAKANKAGFKI